MSYKAHGACRYQHCCTRLDPEVGRWIFFALLAPQAICSARKRSQRAKLIFCEMDDMNLKVHHR
jgi:hypothetical protein